MMPIAAPQERKAFRTIYRSWRPGSEIQAYIQRAQTLSCIWKGCLSLLLVMVVVLLLFVINIVFQRSQRAKRETRAWKTTELWAYWSHRENGNSKANHLAQPTQDVQPALCILAQGCQVSISPPYWGQLCMHTGEISCEKPCTSRWPSPQGGRAIHFLLQTPKPSPWPSKAVSGTHKTVQSGCGMAQSWAPKLPGVKPTVT